jgi:hypothetical protein
MESIYNFIEKYDLSRSDITNSYGWKTLIINHEISETQIEYLKKMVSFIDTSGRIQIFHMIINKQINGKNYNSIIIGDNITNKTLYMTVNEDL